MRGAQAVRQRERGVAVLRVSIGISHASRVDARHLPHTRHMPQIQVQ
jgi:hypothetical protein